MDLFVSFAVPADLDKWAETVLGEENGFSRAITFSNIPTMLGNLYGSSENLLVTQWIEDGDRTYEIMRSTPWVSKVPLIDETESPEAPKPGKGEPPEGLFNLEKLRHSDYKIVTPIDVRKWDAAKWRGVFFMTQPGGDVEPVMALMFSEREPAVAIFQGFRERFGEHDPDNALRISILTGVNISNPHAYAVIVGPNVNNMHSSKNTTLGFVFPYQCYDSEGLSKPRHVSERVSSSRTISVGRWPPSKRFGNARTNLGCFARKISPGRSSRVAGW
jgi:hypothetical protein